jgi:hypothetical protein
MSKRSLSWLRRNTNVEDLLDDGIENNSDLQSFTASDSHCDENRADVSTQTLPPPDPNDWKGVDSRSKLPASYFGLVLGAAITLFGLLLLFFPVDMVVYHLRARALQPLLEHVTIARSQFYGAAGVLFGLTLLAFSIYKPRR